MNNYSASFNFPSGFYWGAVLNNEIINDKDFAASYLFRLKERGIIAILLEIYWSECEPLKGKFDENYIDNIRSFAARAGNQNIQPIIILNTRKVPNWQNLDHAQRANKHYENRVIFTRHMAEAILPYTNYFCLTDDFTTDYSLRDFDKYSIFFREIADYLHSRNDTAQIGMTLSEKFLIRARSSIYQLIHHNRLKLFESLPVDFVGISTEQTSINGLQELIEHKKPPVLFISDKLRSVAPDKKIEFLSDRLYDTWMLYQKGWVILGFCSEIDFNENNQAVQLFVNSSKQNSFEISTEMSYLPDKWNEFLRS